MDCRSCAGGLTQVTSKAPQSQEMERSETNQGPKKLLDALLAAVEGSSGRCLLEAAILGPFEVFVQSEKPASLGGASSPVSDQDS